MKIPIELDRSSKTPLTAQLAAQLGDLIRQRRIPAGTRLPSSRTLSDQLGVARNTVVHAYETLSIEGLVESRAASGFFATPELTERRRRNPSPPNRSGRRLRCVPGRFQRPPIVSRATAGQRDPRSPLLRLRSRPPQRGALPGQDLAAVAPGPAVVRRGRGNVGARRRRRACRRCAPRSLSICRSAGGSWRIPRQVLVVGGIQEGLSITARLLLVARRHGDHRGSVLPRHDATRSKRRGRAWSVFRSTKTG